MRERTIEARLAAGAEARGGISYKWTSPGRRGVPDRIVVLPVGRIYFVETKAPGGHLSPIQDATLEKLRRLGVQTTVLGSILAVDLFFKAIDEGDL